jgi:Uma2 family endonuclease
MTTITLDLSPITTLNREQFRQLCAANPEMKLERNAKGKLIIMAPTGGEMGNWNSEIIGELYLWNKQQKTGKVFDSSTGFSLPQGSDRSPDAAWISQVKWDALTPEQRQGFLPLCPDFAIELLSPSDSWHQGTIKMAEYQANGLHLGWLLDPKSKRVGIYRLNQPVEILEAPDFLSGEDVLIGFTLDVRFLWHSGG